MPYLDRFDYDIFLSYSWAGNQNASVGDRSFISSFQNVLELELRERLSKSVNVFIDLDRPRNGNTESLFHNSVRRSAVFIAVVTPGFVAPDSFCLKELTWFCKKPRPISTEPLTLDERIFKVVTRPLQGVILPQVIAEHSPYTFYKCTGSHNPADFTRFVVDDLVGGEFNRLVVDLQSFLYRQKLYQASSPARTIFLAETTAIAARRRISGELIRHELIDCPLSAGLSEAEYVTALDLAVAQADCSIHLIDPSASLTTPDNWDFSVFHRQLDAANRVRKSRFRSYVWCKSGEKIRDPELESLLTQAKEEMSKNGNVKYMLSGMEKLMSDILPTLTQDLWERPSQVVSASNKRLFVQCQKEDLGKLMPVFSKLNSLGIDIQLPIYDSPDKQRDAIHAEFLAEAYATLVYWGTGGNGLIYTLCDKTMKLGGNQIKGKPRLLGKDPPEDPVRKYFTHRNFKNIPFPTNIDEVQLRATFL